MKAHVSSNEQDSNQSVQQSTTAIRNVKAYSENTSLDVLAAVNGEYTQLDGVFHVSALTPCETLNGGPSVGDRYTLAFDMNRNPSTLKHMEYQGRSTVTGAFRFAG